MYLISFGAMARLLYLSFAAALIAIALAIPAFAIHTTLTQPTLFWVNLLFDDAYYYLGVARNVALGHGSMFAAPFETNGYQPLWTVPLTAVALLVGADRMLTAAGTHILVLGIMAVTIILSKRMRGVAWPAAAVMLLFPYVFTAGLETVLILPLAILYFAAPRGWQRGVLAGLLFLARLDAVGLIVGRAVFELAVERRIDWRQHLLLGGIASCYVGMNLIVFGTPLPVSGQAKAVGLVIGENWRACFAFLSVALPVSVAALQLMLFKDTLRKEMVEPIVASLIAIACSASYYGMFSGWPIWLWYFWPVSLAVYFTLVAMATVSPPIAKVKRLAAEVGRVAACLALLDYAGSAAMAYKLRYWVNIDPHHIIRGSEFWDTNVRQISRINASSLPAGTMFAMGDRAGSFGYFLDSRFRFLQTEGLVANTTYLHALRTDAAGAFVDRAGIDFLIVDRAKIQRLAGLYLVPEPSQARSAHIGPFLLCFPAAARTHAFDGGGVFPQRFVFIFAARVTCPQEAVRLFLRQRSQFGQISAASY